MTHRISSIVAALAFSVASTATSASEHYKVSASISDGGQEFAAPEFVAIPGEVATVGISGTDGYTLAVTVEPLPDGTLKLSTDLESRHGEMAPVLIVAPGKPASVAVGELSMTLTASPDAD